MRLNSCCGASCAPATTRSRRRRLLFARTQRDYARSSELIVQTVDALMGMSGTAGFAASSPIQRAWRDVHFASSHVGLDVERNYSMFGRAELGVPGD